MKEVPQATSKKTFASHVRRHLSFTPLQSLSSLQNLLRRLAAWYVYSSKNARQAKKNKCIKSEKKRREEKRNTKGITEKEREREM